LSDQGLGHESSSQSPGPRPSQLLAAPEKPVRPAIWRRWGPESSAQLAATRNRGQRPLDCGGVDRVGPVQYFVRHDSELVGRAAAALVWMGCLRTGHWGGLSRAESVLDRNAPESTPGRSGHRGVGTVGAGLAGSKRSTCRRARPAAWWVGPWRCSSSILSG
jgi:hypothetical protein